MRPAPIPARPRSQLRRKLVWTTLVSVVVFAVCYVIYVEHLITLDSLSAPFEPHMTPLNRGE